MCLESKFPALQEGIFTVFVLIALFVSFCSLREYDHSSAHKLPYRSYSIYIK